MSADKKHISITLSKESAGMLEELSRHGNVSQSAKASELLADILELYEDVALAKIAERRIKRAKERNEKPLKQKEVLKRLFGK